MPGTTSAGFEPGREVQSQGHQGSCLHWLWLTLNIVDKHNMVLGLQGKFIDELKGTSEKLDDAG